MCDKPVARALSEYLCFFFLIVPIILWMQEQHIYVATDWTPWYFWLNGMSLEMSGPECVLAERTNT